MTVLANTKHYLVEYDQSPVALLSIVHVESGKAVSLTGKRVAGEFRDCLKTHTADRVIETFIKLGGNDWRPMYKPGRARNHLSH